MSRDQGTSQGFSPSPEVTYPQLRLADVIISGNGLTLYHVYPTPVQPFVEVSQAVRFWEGEWHKSEVQADPRMADFATREEILLVLSSLEHVHIRATYDQVVTESSLINLQLETGIDSNSSSLRRAIFVERCSCPIGHNGSSCEVGLIDHIPNSLLIKIFILEVSRRL